MENVQRDNTFKDLVAVIKRRGKTFAFVAAPVLTIGVGIAFGLPAIFESRATILVEQQDVPEYLVRSTITSAPEERIRIITERVLRQENLADLIAKYGLAEEPGEEGQRGAVRMIRRNVAIDPLESDVLNDMMGSFSREGESRSLAFTIAYGDRSPQRALDVTNELVALYLNENQRVRQELAGETQEFLAREAGRLEKEIAEREAEIAEFKAELGDSLPELSELNLQLMDRAERDLEDVEREIRTLREQQTLLSSELAQLSPYAVVFDQEGKPIQSSRDRLKTLQRQYVQQSAVYGQDHPDVLKTKRELEALSRQTGLPGIDTSSLQVELAARLDEVEALRQRYSPDYPDVLRVERIIANLRTAIAQAPPTASSNVPLAPPDNPLYIQKQVQLQGAELALEAAVSRRADLRRRLETFETRLSMTPEVERDYASMRRGYEQLVEQFAEVEQKQRQAEIAQNLESESMGERFTVLNAPTYSSLPVRPNRIAILMLGIALALAAGFSAVMIKEHSDATIRNGRDVAEYLEIPPLVVIPCIYNDADLHDRRWSRLRYGALAGLWIGVMAILIIGPSL
jgi:uncharacterized protein involved in exopolysaccharide biosynthesis